jgi:hypothetical protein
LRIKCALTVIVQLKSMPGGALYQKPRVSTLGKTPPRRSALKGAISRGTIPDISILKTNAVFVQSVTLCQFRSLAEPWADTATSTGRLMMPFSATLPT